MIAGLRTFAATANPVKNRENINIEDEGDSAARTTPKMKIRFAMLKTGYRPNTSDNGAIKRGPAASPSSQTVTRSMADDLLSVPSRSNTMREAMGTTPMQVNVLFSLVTGREFWEGVDERGECHETK